MQKKRIGHIILLASILIIFASLLECAIANKKASDYSFGEECKHCHGEYLEGNYNIKKQCGRCHEFRPLAAVDVENKTIRENILFEPHVHKTGNLFSSTPSCFICHRQNDF